jgi:hypothetical protein
LHLKNQYLTPVAGTGSCRLLRSPEPGRACATHVFIIWCRPAETRFIGCRGGRSWISFHPRPGPAAWCTCPMYLPNPACVTRVPVTVATIVCVCPVRSWTL